MAINPPSDIVLDVARAADPAERDRLWQALVDLGTAAYTHANARQRPRETAIVVLEPSAD